MMLSQLFYPRTIAVIGASRSQKKIGGAVIRNLLKSGFRGSIYPVNPSARIIQGIRCYPSILAVPVRCSVAIIAVPASLVAQVLTEAGKKRIPFAVIISAGFGEIGALGTARDVTLRVISRRYGIRIVGPNCLGIINTHARLNASFSASYPDKGSVSFISQSGALMVSMIDWALRRQMGMGTLISLGNESGVTEIEALSYLAHDRETKVIGMYLEKVTNGPDLIRVIRKVSRTKPIVLIKAGASAAGQKAITSHTGSLAGSVAILQAAALRAGATYVKSLEDLFYLLKLYSLGRTRPRRNLTIISNAGGPSIVTVDAASLARIPLSQLSPATRTLLRNKLPAESSVQNPIDLLGDADAGSFKLALDAVLRDKNVGPVALIVTPQTMTPVNDIARIAISRQKRTHKIILPCFIGGRSVSRAKSIVNKDGCYFDFPNDAIRILDAMTRSSRDERIVIGKPVLRKIPVGTKIQLPYHIVERNLHSVSIPIIKSNFIAPRQSTPKGLRFPLAAKAVVRSVVHKRSSGAVILDIASRGQLNDTLRRFSHMFARKLEGVYVQPMAKPGTELILGYVHDALMGDVYIAGIGGSFTEDVHDIGFYVGKPDLRGAKAMLAQLRHTSIITSIDVPFVAHQIVRLSRLIHRHPEIIELDLNPFIAYRRGGIAVDARIVTMQT